MLLEHVIPKSHKNRLLVEYVATVVVAVGLALLAQAFIVKPFMIPSTSMANTLVPGQRVLVNRLVYRYRDVHRGDIIVFHRPAKIPEERFDVLIKRVVGLPGDTLSLKGGRLYVNGRPLSEPYVDKVGGVPEPTTPADISADAPGAPGWTLVGDYTVPAGQYFVMGDNRTDSSDSRYWGTVARGDIIGQAFFSYWPLQRLGSL